MRHTYDARKIQVFPHVDKLIIIKIIYPDFNSMMKIKTNKELMRI